MNIGSGTWISNVNLASFERMPEFFNTHFEIDANLMEDVKNEVHHAFGG